MREKQLSEGIQEFADEMKMIGEQSVKSNILHIIRMGALNEENDYLIIRRIKSYLGEEDD